MGEAVLRVFRTFVWTVSADKSRGVSNHSVSEVGARGFVMLWTLRMKVHRMWIAWFHPEFKSF